MQDPSDKQQPTPLLTTDQQPVVLLFSDDSTLFFACLMRELLTTANPGLPIEMCLYTKENALSERQLDIHLPEGPDRECSADELYALTTDHSIRAIVTSRIYAPLRSALIEMDAYPETRQRDGRPCLISFLGGLDFFPETGFRNRRRTDAIFLMPRANIGRYQKLMVSESDMPAWQILRFGHPAALTPKSAPADLSDRKDIYFFTQAISPKTRAGRQHVLDALIAIAERNPERDVYLKLRHLPDENKKHLHREKHDYPSLLSRVRNRPPNLKVSACTMADALEQAAIAITCTSTAALDAISAGIPTMIYLDYVDNFADPLNREMRKIFQDSELIVPLERLLSLTPGTAHPEWISDTFATRELGAEVLDVIEAFEARPNRI